MPKGTHLRQPVPVDPVEKVAKARGCVGPYPCGRNIPEFGGRDAPCACEQMVDAAADALATRLVNPAFGPTHAQLKWRERDRAATAIAAAIPLDPAWGPDEPPEPNFMADLGNRIGPNGPRHFPEKRGKCPVDPDCTIHNEFMPWAGIHHQQMADRQTPDDGGTDA